jgi:glycosyltransferase involved in cell wall biosynthesis
MQRGAFRRELGIGDQTPLVGIVGRLCRIKNHELFFAAAVRIAAILPAVRLVVVGDGELGGQLRARAHQLNLTGRIVFTGCRYDLDRVYADLDVLVLCSNNEGAPMVLMEAMAAGCPVVATAVGGVPDLISHQRTGLLVPPGQPDALAAAVSSLLLSRATAVATAESAQRHARIRFACARFVSDMDGLYQQLLRERACLNAAAAVRGRRGARRASATRDKDVGRHALA